MSKTTKHMNLELKTYNINQKKVENKIKVLVKIEFTA